MSGKVVNLTGWYDYDIHPVYRGWYHTMIPFDNVESRFNWWWDGFQWLSEPDGDVCINQRRMWRGIQIRKGAAMIIGYPNDGEGFLYHIIDLNGQTVHAYRDSQAALRAVEGDQRIFVQIEKTGEWVGGDAPKPDLD